MLRKFRADLHIHTCLSPCGSLAMVPGLIVKQARTKGLDAIGICDHNATENVAAVRGAAEKESIVVLGGMEITSQEEVHALALFDDYQKLYSLQKMVYDHLPGTNDREAFGEQVVVNENDQVVDVNDRLLAGATDLPLEKILDAVHSLSGLAIASHVDRQAFGIIGQLGFIPEGLAVDALEVSPRMSPDKARKLFPHVADFPIVSFSDAHRPEDVGNRCTTFLVKHIALEEMKMALLRQRGRDFSLTE